jgi:hypothetical protein
LDGCKEGNKKKCFFLRTDGARTEPNAEKMANWEKACESGNPSSCLSLTGYYERPGHDKEAGLKWSGKLCLLRHKISSLGCHSATAFALDLKRFDAAKSYASLDCELRDIEKSKCNRLAWVEECRSGNQQKCAFVDH